MLQKGDSDSQYDTINITVVFYDSFYVLNIPVSILPDEGEWSPKQVGGIKKLYLYV
jgi:hypothetical protein